MIKSIQPVIARQLNALRSSKSSVLFPACHCRKVSPVAQIQHRDYSYYKSRSEEEPDKYTKYEKSFKEWSFVEKLIPPSHVPAAPTDFNASLPSGWTPPNPPKDCTYLIRRTKNHQIPVYVKIWDRGQVRYTHIGKVEGNIWQLEKDIGRYLQRLKPDYPIIIRTHEISRQVITKGEHVEEVKEWVINQGF